MLRDYGKDRADYAVPMRDMLGHKLIVSAGSDWAGDGEDNPFEKIYFYVTRKTKSGAVAGLSQKISREDALRVSTINNAYLTFEENRKGSIEIGKLADFVILSGDVLTVPDEALLSLRPRATYVAGKLIFSNTPAEPRE
jgi:predicted amidohydrolase YtcJ